MTKTQQTRLTVNDRSEPPGSQKTGDSHNVLYAIINACCRPGAWTDRSIHCLYKFKDHRILHRLSLFSFWNVRRLERGSTSFHARARTKNMAYVDPDQEIGDKSLIDQKCSH
jgi:hypothetical protein